MGFVRGDLMTAVVDLTELSLAEVRTTSDPMFLRSMDALVGRMECGQLGILQNQAPDEL